MEPIPTTPPEPIPTTPPEVPEELELKEWMLQLLEEEVSLSDDEKEEIRREIVAFVNKIVDIPWIGEKLEEKLFSFTLKVFEKVGVYFGKKLISKIF